MTSSTVTNINSTLSQPAALSVMLVTIPVGVSFYTLNQLNISLGYNPTLGGFITAFNITVGYLTDPTYNVITAMNTNNGMGGVDPLRVRVIHHSTQTISAGGIGNLSADYNLINQPFHIPNDGISGPWIWLTVSHTSGTPINFNGNISVTWIPTA